MAQQHTTGGQCVSASMPDEGVSTATLRTHHFRYSRLSEQDFTLLAPVLCRLTVRVHLLATVRLSRDPQTRTVASRWTQC